jgi:hypothetical protein
LPVITEDKDVICVLAAYPVFYPLLVGVGTGCARFWLVRYGRPVPMVVTADPCIDMY